MSVRDDDVFEMSAGLGTPPFATLPLRTASPVSGFVARSNQHRPSTGGDEIRTERCGDHIMSVVEGRLPVSSASEPRPPPCVEASPVAPCCSSSGRSRPAQAAGGPRRPRLRGAFSSATSSCERISPDGAQDGHYAVGASMPCFCAIATMFWSSNSSGGAGRTRGVDLAGLPASAMNRSTPAGD